MNNNYKLITHSIQFAVPQLIIDAEIETIVKLVKNVGKGLVIDVGVVRRSALSTQVGKIVLDVSIIYYSNTHNLVEGEIEPIEEIIRYEVNQYIAALTAKYDGFGGYGSWTTC